MFTLKQIAIAALALSTTTLYAATHSTPIKLNQNIDFSSTAPTYEVSISGLYLYPKYMGMTGQAAAHAVCGDDSCRVLDGTPYEQKINPHLTLKIEGIFHLQNDNDLTINYYHMFGKQSRFSTAGSRNLKIAGASNLQTYINPSWDALNIEFGQHLNIGSKTTLTYYSGIHFAHIETDMQSRGPLTKRSDTEVIGDYNYSAKSTFTGIGPKFGLALNHPVNDKISLHMNAAVALLAGESRFADHYNFNYTTTPELPFASPSKGSYQSLFPFIENQVGINYLLTVDKRTFDIDAGCFFIDYFNVQQSTSSKKGNVNNLALFGPYISLKWLIS